MNGISEVVRIKSGEKNLSKNFEIILPEGRGTLTAGEEFDFRAGQAIIIPPRTGYVVQSAAGALRVALEQALLSHREISVIDDDKSGGLAFAAKQAEIYMRSQTPKKEGILSALGGLIAAYATAFSDCVQISPVVATVRADILRHLSDCTYSLEDALKRLPLNYDYVRKLFKKQTSITPHEYLLRERMGLAKKIIQSGITNRYSEYTVAQIAEACGFSEPLYFSRVFKKYFGVSPTHYREDNL